MWRQAVVGVAALTIAGSTFVLAQSRGDEGRRGQFSMQDMRAFADARLAALRAGLALTPDQEKNWPAFEQAARDFQKLRLDRLNSAVDARRNARPRTADPVERMEQRANAFSETGAALKKLADATGPLYNSLDDGQKRRFAILSRLGREGEGLRGRFERGDGGFRRGEEREDRGFRRGEEREERGFRRGEERRFENRRSLGFEPPANEERL